MNPRRCALVVALLTFVTVATLGVAIGPSPFIGDEMEYLSMTYAIAANRSPTLTPAVVKAVREANPGNPIPTLIKAVDGSDDTLHFWFLSALAMPFFWLCKAVGLDGNRCFAFLNALALAAATGVTSYYFRWCGAALLLIAFAASPLFPYLIRIHGEAFSVSLLTVAVVFLVQDQLLAAALAISLIAAQVSAFSPLAAILLFHWASRAWKVRRRPARSELAMVAACVCLLILQPLWTLERHHVLNIIVSQGFAKPELVSLKRILGMFMDPDVGLFFNWPAGIAIVLLIVIGLWRNPTLLRKDATYWVFVAGAAVYLGYASATQANYTSSIPRYALWFLPLFLISLILVYERERCKEMRGFAAAIAVVWIAGSAANFCYSATVTGFQPLHRRRPQAELWYRTLPAAFDPEEQVFVDFTLHEQLQDSYALFMRGRYPIIMLRDPHIWALSNKACTKLLVFAYAFTSSYVQPRLPFGCEEKLDPAQLLDYVRRVGGSGMRDRYVNLTARELARMKGPPLPPVPPPPPNRGPRVESTATTARNGSDITYAVRVSDPNGWQDIDSVFFIVAESDNETHPGAVCYIVYNQPRNVLATKTATEELIYGYPGHSALLRGAHCRVDSANVKVTASGESLMLTMPVALDPVLAKPEALVQSGVTDLAQVSSGWQRAR